MSGSAKRWRGPRAAAAPPAVFRVCASAAIGNDRYHASRRARRRRREGPMKSRPRIEERLGVACMVVLTLITLGNVLTRYLTDESFAWTEEISVFLIVVMTLAGAAVDRRRATATSASNTSTTAAASRGGARCALLAGARDRAASSSASPCCSARPRRRDALGRNLDGPRRAALVVHRRDPAALPGDRPARRWAGWRAWREPPRRSAAAELEERCDAGRCATDDRGAPRRPVRRADAGRRADRASRSALGGMVAIGAANAERAVVGPARRAAEHACVASPSTRCWRCRCSCWSARSSTAPASPGAWSPSPRPASAARPACCRWSRSWSRWCWAASRARGRPTPPPSAA